MNTLKLIDAGPVPLTEADLNGSGMLPMLPLHVSQVNANVRDVLRLILRDRIHPRSRRLARALDELFTSRFCGSNQGTVLAYIQQRVPEQYHRILSPYSREEYRQERLMAVQRRNEVKVPFCEPGCDQSGLIRGAGKATKPKWFCPTCGRAHSPTGEPKGSEKPRYKPLFGQVPLSVLRRKESKLPKSIYVYA